MPVCYTGVLMLLPYSETVASEELAAITSIWASMKTLLLRTINGEAMKELCQPTCFTCALQLQSIPLQLPKDGLPAHCTRNGSQRHLSSGKVKLLWASADFGSHWTGAMQTLCSDTHQKSLKLHHDTSSWYCNSSQVPADTAAILKKWPPFNFSGHGSTGSVGPGTSLIRKSQSSIPDLS